ncbi:MAG: hypothetical protein EA350_15660 [Gemmatimonadales bacterium]|nr:MAG: hypothetical protein EA350_15660 [Gemmatimonadales bacterium]
MVLVASLVLLSVGACQVDDTEPVGSQDWLTGDTREKLETITHHLRGFDMAMVETGYRYSELYWAGHDRNWDYARYQVEKIDVALARGLERRPARAASAQQFLNGGLPDMGAAVESEDWEVFHEQFEIFTISCNACHAAEGVPHFRVQIPDVRQSPIRFD